MVSSCCICAKENNSFEPERSFHRIPANEEMRNKWFRKIGRVVSYKGARVCSDHFTENDYHNINLYSRRRRLKNTAVPSVILQKEENAKRKLFPLQRPTINSINDVEIMYQGEKDAILYNSGNYENHNTSNDIEIKEEENANDELVLTRDTSKNLYILLNSEKEINATCINNKEKIDTNFENNINDISRERKFPSPNLGTSKTRKILLKFSKHRTVCFTKTDFLSDEKWTAFLKCIAYKKHENRFIRQRNKCLQKRILIFQDMLQDLLRKT